MGKIKRFFSSTCCRCMSATKVTETNSRPIVSISRSTTNQAVDIHDIISDKNGKSAPDNNGYVNPTFAKDDDVFAQPVQCSREDFGRPRQVSDVSELFRVPYDDGKGLTEMVFEELDKSRTLSRDQSRDSSDRRPVETFEEAPSKKTIRRETSSSAPAGEQKNFERVSAARDDLRSDGVNAGEQNHTKSAEIERNISEAKHTEWKERLRQDLLNDDEFFEELSDDDNDDDDENLTPTSQPVARDSGVESEKMRASAKKSETLESTQRLATGIPLVIDNGSHKVRFGWAGEFQPAACNRTVVGRWRAEASEAWQEALGSKFVGETAISRHMTLALEHPMQDGKVTNWRALQEVWEHVVSEQLEDDITSHPVIVSESTSVDSKQRERMLEVLIETMRAPAVTLRNQAVLSSLATNRKVAMVVQCGHGSTEVVPVYEGYQIQTGSSQVLPVGGRHITNYLARLAQREKGASFTSVAEMEIINDIKERFAAVTTDRHQLKQNPNQEIQLPDGTMVELGKELAVCAEPLFDPSLVGSACPGIPKLLSETVERVDVDVIKYGNHSVLLAGGTANLKGLQSRLQMELKKLSNSANLSVHVAECSENAAWIGGSILAEQANFLSGCVTEDRYFEHGAKAVHRFCF